MLKQAPFLSLPHAQFTNIYLLPPPSQHPWLSLHVMLCPATSCSEEAGVLRARAVVSFHRPDVPLLSSRTALIFPSDPLAWTAAQTTPSNSCQQGHCTARCSRGLSRSQPWAVSGGSRTVPDTPSWAVSQQKQGRMRSSGEKQGQTQPRHGMEWDEMAGSPQGTWLGRVGTWQGPSMATGWAGMRLRAGLLGGGLRWG